MGANAARERVMHVVLEREGAARGDRTVLYFEGKEYTVNDLNVGANRVASGLQRLGIAKGDKVAIVMDNCLEFLHAQFGLSKLGTVQVPINTAHKGDLLTYLLDQSDSAMLLVHSHYVDRVGAVLGNTPKVNTVVVVDKGVGGQGQGSGVQTTALREAVAALGMRILDWSELVDNDGSYKGEEVCWSDPAVIVYTSGTTGPSKGVVLPHNYFVFISEFLCRDTMHWDDRDCIYNMLPLFHVWSQVAMCFGAIAIGARVVLVDRFSVTSFWDDVRRYGCTTTGTVGSILALLLKAEPKPDDGDNPLRTVFANAATRDISEPFEDRFGVKVTEGFGMTEGGGILTPVLAGRRIGSCGKPSAAYDAKLVDDYGVEVGPRQIGELLWRPLRPYSVLLEYYKMPEKTVEAWRDLWFHTGDYFYYDEDGYYYFVDRKKDCLRRRGENISSFEVEMLINAHPAVLESAAVGVRSDVGEDDVMICLVLKPGQTLAPEDLLAYCEDRMAHFMVPRYARFLEAMPKTPTLRTQKYLLRQQGVTSDTWDRVAAGYKLKR